MITNSKKYIAVAGLATALLSGAMMVSAQDSPTATAAKVNQKMVLEVGPAGRTLMRGTVTVVGTNSLTVKSWGGDWVVNVSASTKLAPRVDMSQFQVGDFVGVQGLMSTSAAWTIDASFVRNWTERKEIKAEVKENREGIKAVIKAITARNWEGVVVGDVNADGSFKLQVGSATYDIKMATGAKVVDKGYVTLSPSSIKAGHTVRVYGPAADTTITASVVRDVSTGMASGR